MLTKAFRYLNLSDLHLGNMKNKSTNIIHNLLTYFEENHKLFITLDMIILNGDIYERLLPTSSVDAVAVMEYLCNLVNFCQKYNVKLRIVNGTPSHDANQIDMFTITLKTLGVNVDYRYMNDISIEYLEEFNLNLLYIPDEIRDTTITTHDDVLKLMVDRNISKVDIAFIHGHFGFQLPGIILDTSHIEEDYLNIVTHYIHVAHIHKPMFYKRILGNGSFDRLAHGEEEKKGGIVVFLNPNGEDSFIFIENKHAMYFKTIFIETRDFIEALEQLRSSIKNVPIGHHIRLVIDKDNPLVNNYQDFKAKLHHYQVILKKIDKDKKEDIMLLETKITNQFQIDKSNVVDLWSKEIGVDFNTNELFKEELSLLVN